MNNDYEISNRKVICLDTKSKRQHFLYNDYVYKSNNDFYVRKFLLLPFLPFPSFPFGLFPFGPGFISGYCPGNGT
jgi:hypothetical protein